MPQRRLTTWQPGQGLRQSSTPLCECMQFVWGEATHWLRPAPSLGMKLRTSCSPQPVPPHFASMHDMAKLASRKQ
eukprot:334210-Rhodomonas_salina.7